LCSPLDLRRVRGVRLEIFQIAVGERFFVRCGQDDSWRVAGVQRFLPARGAKTPAVARREAGEAPKEELQKTVFQAAPSS
jgi:hypothetical protein